MSKIVKTALLAMVLIMLTTGLSGCSLKTYEGFRYSVEDDTVIIRTYKDKSTVKSLVIPDEIDGMPVVEVANFGAFNATSLLSITIGKNVREIGGWAFTNNTSLKEYIVDPGNAYFTAVDGVLFSKDMKTLIYYPIKKGVSVDTDGKVTGKASYTVPAGVDTIRTKAFYKCGDLEQVVLPAGLVTIEEKAFHKATALKNIELPASLTSVGKDACAFCETMTQITIPANVTQIGDYAFFSCTGLKQVTMLCKQDAVTLGNRWYPTKNGMEMGDLTITWAD